MTNNIRHFVGLASLLFLISSSNAWAGLLYSYHELALKDLDQMNKLVSDKISESKKSGSGQSVPLKECIQAVYSRPDDDVIIDKVVGPLKTRLSELGVYEKTIENLTQESLNALQNSKNFKPAVQVTYAYFLENLMAQFKSAAVQDGFEKKMIKKIAESNVSLSKAALSERKIRLMKESKAPSEIAREILEKLDAPKPNPEPSPTVIATPGDLSSDKGESSPDPNSDEEKK